MSAIARWLIDNASTGLMSGTLVDDTGNGNTLTIDNTNSDGNWASVAAGNGFTANVAAQTSGSMICELVDIATNGNIGALLANSTTASIRLVADLVTAGAAADHLFHIGTLSGNGDIKVSIGTTLSVAWDRENAGGYLNFPLPSGLTVIDAVIDTAQAAESDRIRLYYNGVQQTASFILAPPQNTALTSVNSTDRYMALFNRPTQNRNARGSLYYAELHNVALTSAQITEGASSLLSNNDTDWVDTTAPILSTPTATTTGGTTASGSVTTDEANGTLYYYASANAAETAATIRTSGSTQAVSETGVQSVSFTGLTASTAYYAHYIHVDAAENESNVVSSAQFTTDAPALSIDSVSNTSPIINTQITVDHSNALGALTTPNFNIASQTGTQAVIDIPDITTFVLAGQTWPTINFNTAVTIPLSDGTNSADVDLTGIQNPAGTLTDEIASIPSNSVFANDTGAVVGMYSYFFNITGNLTILPESGVILSDGNGGSCQYKLYNGEWGSAATVTINAVEPDVTPPSVNPENPVPASLYVRVATPYEFSQHVINPDDAALNYAVAQGSPALPEGVTLNASTGTLTATTNQYTPVNGLSIEVTLA